MPPHFAGWKNAMRFAGGATSAEHGARDRRTNFRSIGFNTCSLPRVSNARSMATLAPSAASIACDGSCNPNFTTTTCHFLYHGLTLALTCHAGALSPRFRVPIFGSEFMRDREGSPPALRAPCAPRTPAVVRCVRFAFPRCCRLMPDGWPMFAVRWRSISEQENGWHELQHLQRIAAWAGASILLQALFLSTGAICYHGIDAGVEAYRLDKSGRATGRRSQKI